MKAKKYSIEIIEASVLTKKESNNILGGIVGGNPEGISSVFIVSCYIQGSTTPSHMSFSSLGEACAHVKACISKFPDAYSDFRINQEDWTKVYFECA